MKIAIHCIAALALVTPELALAQAPPSSATPAPQTAPSNATRPTNCAPTQALPSDSTIQPRGTTGQDGAQLTDKLAQSDGVLCPPAGVGNDMTVAPPGGGRTPIIPPPPNGAAPQPSK